tara:strand:- start:2879 stop:3157 length:279 start_codon:yes stop_codon:yes gene_type:complete
MTKSDLIEAVQQADGVPELTKKSTAAIVEAVFDAMKMAIDEDDRFSYPGFGTFKKKHRKARKGRNPKTNEEITIPARMTVSFKAAPSFRGSL